MLPNGRDQRARHETMAVNEVPGWPRSAALRVRRLVIRRYSLGRWSHIPDIIKALFVNDTGSEKPDLIVKHHDRRVASCFPWALIYHPMPMDSVARIPDIIVVVLSVKPIHQPYFAVKHYSAVKNSGR